MLENTSVEIRDWVELELELIQTYMTQKLLVWVEVGAHAVRNMSKCCGMVRAGADVAWRLGVCVEGCIEYASRSSSSSSSISPPAL